MARCRYYGSCLSVLLVLGTGLGCGADAASTKMTARLDHPVLVPWHRIGNISLSEPRESVARAYPSARFHVLQRYAVRRTEGYFVLHGSHVVITYYSDHV